MVRRVPLQAAAVVAMVVGAGCGLKEDGGDLVAGKQAFVARCGACHALQRAGTKGITGPDLDEAFRVARQQGMKESTIEGVVAHQIQYPIRSDQTDQETGRSSPGMPADLVKGDTVKDVAAYVAAVAAKPGQDTGELADVGVKEATGTAKVADGVLAIPADPTGQLRYQFASAQAPAGQVDVQSKNASPIPHNIVIEGNGVDQGGKVVSNGGVSEVKVDLKAGQYTFYCSVTGHRAAGMEGKLTVK